MNMKRIFKLTLGFTAVAFTLALGVALGQRLRESRRGGPAFAAGSDAAPLSLAPAPAAGAGAGVPNFADVAERVNHAVVAITATEFVDAPAHPQVDGFPFPFFFGPGQGEPRRRKAPPGGEGEEGDGQGETQRQVSGGSGFLITPDGYILTNHHVIDNASKIEVTLEDDRKFTAKLVGSDQETDLALLKIDGHDLPVVPLGDSDKARVGEWVLAIGNPLEFSHTVTVGVLSGKGRRLSGDSGISSFLQTDAAINFGNSGGPLVNTRGEVIGINDAIIRNDGMGRTIEGIGFAIPVNTAKQIVDELRSRGKVSRGYLGVSVGPLQDETRTYYEKKYKIRLDGGALVHKVEEGTPAQAEGITAGDIIVEADGRPVKDSESLVKIIAGRKPGEKIKLKFYRKGELKSAAVALADRAKRGTGESGGDEEKPDSSPAPQSYEKRLGFKIEPLSDAMRRQLELPAATRGVAVSAVSPRSKAYEAGLRPGWVITELNDEPVKSPADFNAQAAKIKAGDTINLVAVRGDNQRVFYFDAGADK